MSECIYGVKTLRIDCLLTYFANYFQNWQLELHEMNTKNSKMHVEGNKFMFGSSVMLSVIFEFIIHSGSRNWQHRIVKWPKNRDGFHFVVGKNNVLRQWQPSWFSGHVTILCCQLPDPEWIMNSTITQEHHTAAKHKCIAFSMHFAVFSVNFAFY